MSLSSPIGKTDPYFSLGFQNYSHTQPEYLPEFQGGYFTAWGSGTFYDVCASQHSPDFPDV